MLLYAYILLQVIASRGVNVILNSSSRKRKRYTIDEDNQVYRCSFEEFFSETRAKKYPKRHLRCAREDFRVLLSRLQRNHKRNGFRTYFQRREFCRRSDIVSPSDEICLLMTLKYLGGSSIDDLIVLFGIAKPYKLIGMTLNAIILELRSNMKEDYWPDSTTPSGYQVYEKRASGAFHY